MRRILIVYATSYGQTGKIAQRLATRLQAMSFDVTVANGRELPPGLRPEAFDAIIVGASIIARGHQPAIRAFIGAHRSLLRSIPTAFFSVCASAGSAFERNRAAGRKVRDEFLLKMGWRPDLTASIAGAVNFTKYGFLLRWYMKRASALNGGSTDTSRDHEYTDWKQVDRFAQDFAGVLTASPEKLTVRS